jgi:hypothetical protein
MKNTIVAVDLAKELIQVCVYTNKNGIRSKSPGRQSPAQIKQ